MQDTAEFHHHIADTFLPQMDPVFDAAMDMLDPPPVGERLIDHALLQREILAARYLGRHEDLHLGEREREEAQIRNSRLPAGKG
jgi:hypothetical protein